MTDETMRRFFGEQFKGRWSAERSVLDRYSTDMGIYRIRPRVVAFPRDEDDVVHATLLARGEQVPLTIRCGGSGTGGGAIGPGIVLVFDGSEGFNSISRPESYRGHYDAEEIRIVCGSGVRHTALQEAFSRVGHFLPSDPSSGPLSFIGGNIATKASGPHELRHGSIDRYLRSVRFVTARGEIVDTADPATIPGWLQDFVRDTGRKIQDDEVCRNRLESRKTMKIASGYNLFSFVNDPDQPVEQHLTQLLAGSVGTLGIILGGELAGAPEESGRVLLLAAFDRLTKSVQAISSLRAHGASAVEILNAECLDILRDRFTDLELPPSGASLTMAEFTGEARDQSARSARHSLETMSAADRPITLRIASTPDEQDQLWTARKRLMLLVKNYSPTRKALSVVNDVGVPGNRLEEFILFAEDLFRRLNLRAPIYGHGGSGNLHLRPLFDISSTNLPSLISHVAEEIYGKVIALGGTVTAEHGMGRLRSPFLEREWGSRLFGLMKEIKQTFDPDDILGRDCMISSRRFLDDFFASGSRR